VDGSTEVLAHELGPGDLVDVTFTGSDGVDLRAALPGLSPAAGHGSPGRP
jgi:hypothetical protein